MTKTVMAVIPIRNCHPKGGDSGESILSSQWEHGEEIKGRGRRGGGGGRRKRISDEYQVKRHRGGVKKGVTTAIRIQMIGEKEGGNQMNTSVR